MNAKENLSPTVRAEAPVAGLEQKEIWGSDAIAAVLRTLDIPFLALNPGASYRGLHDSIVNYLGNTRPRSEEHTSELQSRLHLVCRLLLEKKKRITVIPSGAPGTPTRQPPHR